MSAEELWIVGKNVEKLDIWEKALGRGKYTSDYFVDNLLHLKVVRSEHPHALIRRIDVTEAMAYHGIVKVLTAKDVPGINDVGFFLPDQPVICDTKVRYMGDGVALVVGETPEEAEEGAELVKVDYQLLPGVFDPEEAMNPGAIKIHETGNILDHHKVRKGDIEKGFIESDIVIEGKYQTGLADHAYLEPEVALAIPETDKVTVISSLQCPFSVELAVRKVLGNAVKNVRIVQAVTGGGFGGKEDSPNEYCARAALAAVRTGKPVLLKHTRKESMFGNPKRHPSIIRRKLGATKDGFLKAVEARIVSDGGAYCSLTPRVVFQMALSAAGPYVVPNVHVDAWGVYTNNIPSGAFRGFGKPQANFAAEKQMDEMADELGIDPIDFRLKNILRVGTRTASNQLLEESVGLEKTLLLATEAANWRDKRNEYARQTGTKRRGIGVACMNHPTSLGPLGVDTGSAIVSILNNGKVVVKTGMTEYGQGAHTGFAQLVAEVLGVEISNIRVPLPDTDEVLDSGPTVASRSMFMGGKAVMMAAERIRAKLNVVASELLDCAEKDVVIKEGRAYAGNRLSEYIPFGDLVNKCIEKGISLTEEAWFYNNNTSWDAESGRGDPWVSYTFATHIAEVEMDMETGQVEVLRYVGVHDVGRVINPILARGQVYGGIVQGLGYAVMEQLIQSDGVILAPGFMDYYIPLATDVPEIVSIFVEEESKLGPFGLKGLGEVPIEPVLGAVGNAISHAVGVPLRKAPFTPEEVYLSIKEADR